MWEEIHDKIIAVLDNHIRYHLSKPNQAIAKLFSDKESEILVDINALRVKLGKKPLDPYFPENICFFCSEN